MRPTPNETVDGIVRILRETVTPAVGDAHAATQLRQIISVLSQHGWNDPAAALREADAALRTVLQQCSTWIAADQARTFTEIISAPATTHDYDSQAASHEANRSALAAFITELREWRRINGPDSSAALFEAIGEQLSTETSSDASTETSPGKSVRRDERHTLMKAILLVYSDANAGDDDAYNEWYDNVHLPEVLAVPGFVAARRYAAEPSVHGELPANRYLAIYEIEADDAAGLSAAQQALSTAARDMQMSAAFDRSSTATRTYRLISETGSA